MVAGAWREVGCDVKSLLVLLRSEEVSTTTDAGRAGRVMNAVGAVQFIALLGSRRQHELHFHVGRV